MKSADVIAMKRPPRGFTLIELMVVVAIAAILAAVAYPSFLAQVRKSRRADAVDLMSRVQQAQERWRANNETYAASMATLAIGTSTGSGHYTVSTAPGVPAGSTFTVTAVAQGSQASDTGCQALRISTQNGTVTYSAGASTGSLATGTDAARRCWNR